MTTGRELGALAASIAVCLLAGALGGFATSGSVESWYPTLAKPTWTPPPWLFGPVWTALYLAMGIAAWLVWRRRPPVPRTALGLFALQLGLNVLWSVLFFGLRRPGLALVEIVVLWLAIAATLAAFAGISRAAAWLLAPYLAWVSFAAALNAAIWSMNA